MPDCCPAHPNTALFTDEDIGSCWICVSLLAAERADSLEITDADGQHREVIRDEFIRHLLHCPNHPRIALVADEEGPVCPVCVTIKIAEGADSWGIIGADDQPSEVSQAEFVEYVQARAREETANGWGVVAYRDPAGVRIVSRNGEAAGESPGVVRLLSLAG
jgi:hypothetical protein